MFPNLPAFEPPVESGIHIKICGITSLKDALLAVEAGADYLGLIFVAASPRSVSIEKAREIAQTLQGQAKLVGVFQHATVEEIQAIVQTVPLDLIQLHNPETAAFHAQLSLPLIQFAPLTESLSDVEAALVQTKASHASEQTVGTHTEAMSAGSHHSTTSPVSAFLLEPPKGSGLSTPTWLQQDPHRRQRLQQLAETVPFFLAGGLTPDTIESVLETFHPFGVDTASGVESSPGVKDSDKVMRFCHLVRTARKPSAATTS